MCPSENKRPKKQHDRHILCESMNTSGLVIENVFSPHQSWTTLSQPILGPEI